MVNWCWKYITPLTYPSIREPNELIIFSFLSSLAAVTKPNCNPSLDIAVVIDETRSVSLSDLIIVLDAAKEMTELFFRRVEDIRFSIVSFAKEAAIRVRFSDPQDKESLKRKFVEMTSDTRTKPTRVDKALEKVNEAFSDPGNRVDSPDVMIIFTDGKTHGHETQLQRENANLMVRTNRIKNFLAALMSPRGWYSNKFSDRCVPPKILANLKNETQLKGKTKSKNLMKTRKSF